MEYVPLNELIKKIRDTKKNYISQEELSIYNDLINFDYEDFIETMKTPNDKSRKFTKIFEEFIDASTASKILLQSDFLTIFKSLKTNKEKDFYTKVIELLTNETTAGTYLVSACGFDYPIALSAIYDKLLYKLGEEQNTKLLSYYDSLNHVEEEPKDDLEYTIRQIYDIQSGEYLYNYQEIFIPNSLKYIRDFDLDGVIKETLDNYNYKEYVFSNIESNIVCLHKKARNVIINSNLPKNQEYANYMQTSREHFVTQKQKEEIKQKKLLYYN